MEKDIHYPLELSSNLDGSFYSGVDSHKKDIESIFSKHWQYLGPSLYCEQPGDSFPAQLAGIPVFITKGPQQELRGFFNICRHRGGPIVRGRGNFRKFTCQYHGWCYSDEGKLIAAPHMKDAEDFSQENFPLRSFKVKEWGGMIFGCLHEKHDLEMEILLGISERIQPLKLSDLAFFQRDSYDIPCNWKLYVDNYLEGYHVPYVHPKLSKVLDMSAYKTELHTWYSLQHSPILDKSPIYASEGATAFYYFIFPNLMLNILPGRMQVNIVEPISNDRCTVHFDYYYPKSQSAEETRRVAVHDRAFSDEVQKEDVWICGELQKAMDSGRYEAGRLCPKFESGVHHFQGLVREHLTI